MQRPRCSGRAASIAIAALLLALAGPLSALDAQPPTRTVRIGHLALAPPTAQSAPIWEAFVQQLGALGWVQGKNLVLESRHAGGRPERLADLAAELVRLRSDVIVASGVSAVLAARRATSTVPIVIAGASDPVAFGLVQSLAHPGANVTGLSDTPGREIEGKRLELLREVVPRLSRVAVVLDSTARRDPAPIHDAAKALRLTVLLSRETADPEEFRQTFAAFKRERAEAVYAPETPINARHRDLIAALAAEHRLPAIYGSREFVDAGGLISYGSSFSELYRRAAVYVDRILRGARPADLPVEQPARLELAVNLRAAAALGLTIPHSIIIRAEHVVR